MKFIFFAPRYHTNQIEVVKALLYNNFIVEFHVFTISAIECHKDIIPISIPVSKFNFGIKSNSGYLLLSFFKYYRVLKKSNPDFIIIRDPVSISPILAAIISRFLGINVVFYSQLIINQNRGAIRVLLYKSLIIFFNAKWYSPILGDLKEKSPKISKLFYVPFPTNLRRSHSENTLGDCIKILCIGKFQYRKNHLLLLKAINLLKSFSNFHLTIVGECTSVEHFFIYDQLIDYIKVNDLSKRVTMHKNVSHDNIWSYYSCANLFVLPSYNEPASISILEAMSYSIPVIVSDDCGNRSYVINEVTGFYFVKNSFIDLARAILMLLIDKDKFESMKRLTQIHVESHFSHSEFLNKFNQCFIYE
jgi:glycosyltransferase involved in cell wall biosynthesis